MQVVEAHEVFKTWRAKEFNTVFFSHMNLEDLITAL
jgi:hypothetical protein